MLVYGAEHDALVPRSGVERTARFYGVAARWLPDVGHDVMLDEGNEQALDTVLSDLSAVLGVRSLGSHHGTRRDAAAACAFSSR